MIPRLARPVIRDICQTTVTFHIYGQALPCPAARTIPLDLLWKGLGQNCFGPANIGILQQDMELPNLQFHAQQIFYIVD
jgi:hypothetical protein